jgi:hypothetical protein
MPDGYPDDPMPGGPGAAPAAPGYQTRGYQEPGYQTPGYPEPGYPAPGYQQSEYSQSGYEPSGYQEPSSGRHHNPGADEHEQAAADPSFAWLRTPERPGFGPSPTMGQPTLPPEAPGAFGPSPSMGQPAVPPAGFGPSPTMGQPAVRPAGFGPSPSMGQPAAYEPSPPFGQPAVSPSVFGQPAAPQAAAAPVPAPEIPAPAGFGPSPRMGQPAVSMEAAAAESVGVRLNEAGLPVRPVPGRRVSDAAGAERSARVAAPPVVTPAPAPAKLDLAAVIDEPPEIPPWDRRPLMIVLAFAAALVLVGVASGFVGAALFDRLGPKVSWGNLTPSPSPGGSTRAHSAGAPAPASDTVTLSGVGDVIMGDHVLGLPPNNGVGFFDPVKADLASDLVMGNLEMPLSDPTGYDKCGPPPHPDCFQFSLPPYFGGVLASGGFQLMNMANNHSNDQGPTGLKNTHDALAAAGLNYTGGVNQITIVTIKGIKVAVLGFSEYSWTANLNDLPHAVDLVKQAAGQADLVVIQMHAGAEGVDKDHVTPGHEIFAGEDRGDELAFTHAVIDAGADVVFGHGPHVMRGMQFYKGRLIAFSLGNFCGYKALNMTGYSGVGGILKVTLHKDGSWASGKLVATEMVGAGSPAIDSGVRALGFVAGLSTDDFGATAAHVNQTTGEITPPE